MERMILYSLLLISCLHHALCYFITVDAHSEECFFDKVSSGTKLGLTFEVVEGGFLDIDVKVPFANHCVVVMIDL